MVLPFAADPHTLPLHVLFPDEYAATKRMIVKDFALYGAAIVAVVVAMAAIYG